MIYSDSSIKKQYNCKSRTVLLLRTQGDSSKSAAAIVVFSLFRCFPFLGGRPLFLDFIVGGSKNSNERGKVSPSEFFFKALVNIVLSLNAIIGLLVSKTSDTAFQKIIFRINSIKQECNLLY